ncbi:asparaginase [Marinomonas rhizomae]|uniref:Asparaginase n=1 Tax=Marinomonas rhizomae TaxID=491948 RepID=A0A366IXM5_9GAMM|nr:asparaginase [Marinomonas rhizomae]RBP79566.1 asparaginase [Marinomonas rhizomae]RNF71569.1 asparaginase [Marinomonas rhizomae]
MQHAPLSVQVTRGGIVESEHNIKAVIVSSTGKIVESWGDVDALVYPRSAIKAMQALAFIEMGGAERFGFSSDEISICCASHNGEPEHVATVQSMLDKLASSETDFECGCHWPMCAEAGYVLAGEGKEPNQLHNNCSGKHAGMLGLANLLGVSSEGYIGIDHPVQQKIADTMADMCEYDYNTAPWSPDGCSAPTWAMPLTNLALAFAKFASPDSLSKERQKACKTLYDAVVENPFMVAGTARYCTDMMSILQKRVFLKVGAEGVYIAAIPELKLAIALKCADGAVRAAESVMTALLDHVGITTFVADNIMQKYRSVTLKNWEKRKTGAIVCEL